MVAWLPYGGALDNSTLRQGIREAVEVHCKLSGHRGDYRQGSTDPPCILSLVILGNIVEYNGNGLLGNDAFNLPLRL